MRLIDADALKKYVLELLDLAIKRVEDTPNDSPCYRIYIEQENERARLIDLINNAPAVELQMGRMVNGVIIPIGIGRTQGEWIRKVDKAGFISHICSECGAEIEVEDCSDDKFCFNCGAEMKGGAE